MLDYKQACLIIEEVLKKLEKGEKPTVTYETHFLCHPIFFALEDLGGFGSIIAGNLGIVNWRGFHLKEFHYNYCGTTPVLLNCLFGSTMFGSGTGSIPSPKHF